MAKFRVKEKSFINNAIKEAGDEVELDIKFDEVLHSNLEPLEPVKAAKGKGKGKADAADEPDEPGGDLA